MRAEPDLLVLGMSSGGVDWAIERLAETLEKPIPLVMVTKGLRVKNDTLRILTDYIAERLAHKSGLRPPVVAIGGPCIAQELAVGRNTTVITTGANATARAHVAHKLECSFYRMRFSEDTIGVEICAAFKNLYAIGVGAASALHEAHGAPNMARSDNPEATVFTQSINEMAHLVRALGGKPETAYGLAGLGDLYVTSKAGRNGQLGRHLGLGRRYSEATQGPMAEETIEGVQLALAATPALETMFASGRLPRSRVPLTMAIHAAIVQDMGLRFDWDRFQMDD